MGRIMSLPRHRAGINVSMIRRQAPLPGGKQHATSTYRARSRHIPGLNTRTDRYAGPSVRPEVRVRDDHSPHVER
jgi:hypothetical protein